MPSTARAVHPPAPRMLNRASAQGERELDERLRAHIEEADLPASQVRYHVIQDSAPHRAITRLGDTLGADLIVLGSHRPRRLLDGVPGSTADRVLRISSRPCLVVNAALHSPPRRLLIATDLSPTADRALHVAVSWGQEWARTGDAPFVVHIEFLYVSPLSLTRLTGLEHMRIDSRSGHMKPRRFQMEASPFALGSFQLPSHRKGFRGEPSSSGRTSRFSVPTGRARLPGCCLEA